MVAFEVRNVCLRCELERADYYQEHNEPIEVAMLLHVVTDSAECAVSVEEVYWLLAFYLCGD